MTQPTDRQARMVQRIAGAQQRLYAYIFSLIGDAEHAGDVLQEANLVLWNKADEFTEGTDFNAWAYRVAHYQVMAFRKKRSRDRLVFDDAVIDRLADETAARLDGFDERRVTLQRCIDRLTDHQRRVVTDRYLAGRPIAKIADAMQMTANAIGQALHRARLSLMDCVRRSPSGAPGGPGATEGDEP